MTTPADDRSRLAALLAHHADVLASRWDAWAPDPAAYSLRLHAGELTANEETPFVRELLDSILAFEAERPDLAVARQVLGTTTKQPVAETPAVDRAAILREAADTAETVAIRLYAQHDVGGSTGAYEVMTDLRRLADEAQQPAPAVTCRCHSREGLAPQQHENDCPDAIPTL